MIFNIDHSTPGDVYADFVLLPVGAKLNRGLLKYSKGDRINMLDGKQYYILKAGLLSMDNPIVAGLCFLRYGISQKKMQMIWRQNAIAYGYGKKAISNEECILLVYGTKNDAESLVSRWKHTDYPLQVQGDTDSSE